MTNEEAKSCIGTIEMLQRLAYNIHGVMDVIDADNCKKIIKALEQKLCEDCISRAWLKEAIHNFFYGLKHSPTEGDIQAYIDAAPSVTPQPKRGRWMHPYKSDIACECSECHIQMPITKDFNYCPSCGSYNGGD